jgi:hypothetical protein
MSSIPHFDNVRDSKKFDHIKVILILYVEKSPMRDSILTLMLPTRNSQLTGTSNKQSLPTNIQLSKKKKSFGMLIGR